MGISVGACARGCECQGAEWLARGGGPKNVELSADDALLIYWPGSWKDSGRKAPEEVKLSF